MILSQRETVNLKGSAAVVAHFMGDWFCINRSLNGFTLTQYQDCDNKLVSQTEFATVEEAKAELKSRVESWLDDLISQ